MANAYNKAHAVSFAAEDGYSGGHGPFASGVVVSSGLGDGLYPVEVRYVDLPDWGRRVAEVRIVFIEAERTEDETS